MLARTRLGLAVARRSAAPPVVLVPTMGALHDGHRALLRRAREIAGPNGTVMVSVFVNPLQFRPGEDLDRYPRTLEADLAICGEESVAVVFAPEPAEMYPREPMITVDPGPMGEALEGASRPGFFTGVLTVVLKLFQLVRPQVAVFGEKDAQQLALVARMCADLDLGVDIVPVPTVRDEDGLATSSRNRYLSAAERATALSLSRALGAASRAALEGPERALAAAGTVLDAAAGAIPPLRLDYLALVDPPTLAPVASGYAGEARLLVAAWVGSTRLIDNMPVMLGAPEPSAAGGSSGRAIT